MAMLRAQRHDEIINDHLIAGLPFVFRDDGPLYRVFVNMLAMQLQTPRENISIIGSGRIGFSLDPDKFGTAFSAASDIDTIVVNAELFDAAWVQLCMLGRKRFSLNRQVQSAFQVHRKNNVFFGFMVPDELPGIVSLSGRWFHTFKQLVSVRALSQFEINGRLYRTWDHVRAHQLYSLQSIASKFKL